MTMTASLDPNAMLVFAALARAGGVRSAAGALGVPRSTVSRRLAELEEALGVVLVVRTARRFALTEQGIMFAERCTAMERLVADAADAVRRRSAEVLGTLRVAAAPVLAEEIMPSLLGRLLADHPKLTVDVRASVDYVDLRRGDVDVALRAAALDDASDLFATRVGVSITGCWASPAYLAARGTPIAPADLVDHECILAGGSRGGWHFQAGRAEETVQVDGRARVDSFRIARDLAIAGGGIVRTALVLVAPAVRTGQLVPVLEKHWVRTPIHAVHAGPSPAPPKVRAFIAIAKRVVPPALAGAQNDA